jgi:hypothetical protein
MKMHRLEEDLIVLNATPIRMRVSQLYGEGGTTLEKAKEKALAEAKTGLSGVAYIRPQVIRAVEAMDYCDIHPEDRKRQHWWLYEISVESGAIKDSKWNRFRWRFAWLLW